MVQWYTHSARVQSIYFEFIRFLVIIIMIKKTLIKNQRKRKQDAKNELNNNLYKKQIFQTLIQWFHFFIQVEFNNNI